MTVTTTTAPSAARRLLLVHAHPDDEVITTGSTMARYAADGVHVALVTCTAGEEGEILVPELQHLEAKQEDRLADVRVVELADAMTALGIGDHRFLGGVGRYRDSGMMGDPANDKPGTFWHADLDEAAGHLVRVVREVRPQVLVTYDENGGYGHPDHIMAHRTAMRAVELAADPAFAPDSGPAWEIGKVYWIATPKSALQRGIDAMKEAGNTTGFLAVESVDDLPFGTPDELVTTQIDGSGYIGHKRRGMEAYPTQISMEEGFFALSNSIGMEFLAMEHFQLVKGDRGVAGGANGTAGPLEQDLFDGVEIPAAAPAGGTSDA